MTDSEETKPVISEPTHQDDFYQKVLQASKKEYTSVEIKQNQQKWERFVQPEKPGNKINDFPNYFYAGFWIRLWAFLIDMICIVSITTATIDVIFHLFQWQMSTAMFSVYGLLSLAIYLAYFTLMTKLNHGQTVGKMLFGIRVVCHTEEELSWQTVLIREVAGRFVLQVNPLLSLGYLPAAFTKRKQHVIDYFTDTSVVTLNMIKAFNNQAQL